MEPQCLSWQKRAFEREDCVYDVKGVNFVSGEKDLSVYDGKGFNVVSGEKGLNVYDGKGVNVVSGETYLGVYDDKGVYTSDEKYLGVYDDKGVYVVSGEKSLSVYHGITELMLYSGQERTSMIVMITLNRLNIILVKMDHNACQAVWGLFISCV